MPMLKRDRSAGGLPVVEAQKEIRRHLLRLEAGKGSLERETVAGKMRTFILDPHGKRIAVAAVKVSYEFDTYFAKYGNGDGLFPGFDQTTKRESSD